MLSASGTTLLAVDLGVKTGFALYTKQDGLVWYRSSNFGSTTRLRRGAGSVLRDLPDLTHVALEGGGDVALIWTREAERRNIEVIRVWAEQWRASMMSPKQMKSGVDAKQTAGVMARDIIKSSGAKNPTSLRHDAAEAVLVGYWACRELGWIVES